MQQKVLWYGYSTITECNMAPVNRYWTRIFIEQYSILIWQRPTA